jgi:hypothetical protein
MRPLVVTLLFGFACIVHASDNSVEVTLEDTPQQQPSQEPALRRWRFQPRATIQNSDSQYLQWRYKFYAGSDKPLGTARDIATIKSVVPSSMPISIRWLSRSAVAVVADCYSDSHSGGHIRCLYVLEKHGSQWKITHHYSHWISTV